MVSPVYPLADSLQTQSEPFVEQHFPRQMSWYAPEGPDGTLEKIGVWIRENPWLALSAAVGAGLVLGLATRSLCCGNRDSESGT